MPFSIQTKDGITINNIPDDISPDSDQIRSRVAQERERRMSTQVEEQRQAQPAFTREEPGFLRTLQGEAELGVTILSGAILEPFAGAAGIVQGLNPFADKDAGRQAVEAVRSLAFTPGLEGQAVAKSIGTIAKEITPDFIQEFIKFTGEKFSTFQEAAFQKYGPVAGTAVAITPVAVLEAIPGLAALKKARNIPVTAADEAIEEVADQVRASGETTIKSGLPPEAKDFTDLAEDINKQNTENLIGEIRPDPEILQSAQNLGVDLNPSHYSTNQKFIEMEQALKANPQSDLSLIEQQAILKTGQEADNFIKELGGDVDKSLLDENVRNEITDTVARLEKDAQLAYSKVNQVIPKEIKVDPKSSKIYIQKRLSDLGGDVALLNSSEKEILRLSKMSNNPTYGALDQVRRNVGEAQSKQSGPFRNDEEAILKQVYGALSEDQQGIADAFSVGADYEFGRKMVSTRKDLEAEALKLFGRDMRGSIIPKIRTAAVSLTKGDVSTFRNLMNDLPPGRRQEAAATMLNEFFASGSRKGRAIGSGFSTAFQALDRSPGAKKIIFDNLPPGSQKKFDDLGKVATGIFKAKAFENVSRTGRSIIAAFQNGDLIAKVVDSDLARLAARLPLGGRTVGLGADITRSIIRKGDDEKVTRAIEFLSSPEFKKSIEAAALGKDIIADAVEKTSKFKNWLSAQPPDIKGEIAAIGFIPWLTQDQSELE